MELNITHMFPDLLNLYGDRGNITSLTYRCQQRGINANVREITANDTPEFGTSDIIFIGGGSDNEMLIVHKKLLEFKQQLKNYVENGGVLIAVCGGYQLLGKYYLLNGEKAEGLSILNIETSSKPQRLIGNIIIETEIMGEKKTVVGFENHGGRTYINNYRPFGKVIRGYGNNGEDGYEGVMYKNVIGTYLHGPLLPKNPALCDMIIKHALEKKYKKPVNLQPLDDLVENNAHNYILNTLLKEKS